MPSRKPRTAAELVAELAQDARYQAEARAQTARAEAVEREVADDEAGLVSELRDAGSPVASVWDFVATGGAAGAALPILVGHLDQPHSPRVWEGIVRALSTVAARQAALERLREEYRKETDDARRWVIANALGSMARFEEVSDLSGIAKFRPLFRESRKPAHRSPAV